MRLVAADEQILVATPATLTGRFYDQDGELAEPSSTVTVSVTAADGTVVLPSGTATTTGTTGVRTVGITAAQNSRLDLLTATWTDGSTTRTTTIEVVGGYYASVRAIRDADDVLADTRKYPAALVVEARRRVESEFEDFCGVSFVPRYRRWRMAGTGTQALQLPDRMLRSVRKVRDYGLGISTSSYYDLTAAQLAAIPASPEGVAYRTDGLWFWKGTDNVVIDYEHGYDRPPTDLQGAFMLRVRDLLNRHNRGVPDRATTFTSDVGGTYSLLVAGRGGSLTGIPDVDVVLKRYSMRVGGIA